MRVLVVGLALVLLARQDLAEVVEYAKNPASSEETSDKAVDRKTDGKSGPVYICTMHLSVIFIPTMFVSVILDINYSFHVYKMIYFLFCLFMGK